MQALVLQPDMDVEAMDILKIVCDGQLVDLESDVSETVLEKERLVGQIGDEPVDQPDQ